MLNLRYTTFEGCKNNVIHFFNNISFHQDIDTNKSIQITVQIQIHKQRFDVTHYIFVSNMGKVPHFISIECLLF